MLKHVSYFFCCVGSRVRGRSMCLFRECFPENQASLNSLLFLSWICCYYCCVGKVKIMSAVGGVCLH